jgi:peptidyl-prolyl cis-trans isomerase SurA
MDPGSATEGGKINATRGMMVPQFEAAVFSLDKNGISDVFETNYGYHIVQLLDRKGDDYSCRHILIIPEFEFEAIAVAEKKMDSCYQLLSSGEISWEEAVTRFSNDETTRQNNGTITNPISGDIMWSMEDLNQVDQQIYLLTNSLEKGDLSTPSLYTNMMERKEGIRIVKLVDRTVAHRANLKDDYALIKSAAESEKKQKIVSEWTTSKIGNAYIRLDEDYKNCNFSNNWLQM